MSRIRSEQRGFTLIEVMLVCSLFLVVLGATLTAFTAFTTNNRRGEKQLEQAEAARTGLDVAARQLRNLANPTVTATTTIDRAEDYDFIFQTSDPAKTWVRYCVQTSAPASQSSAWLWEAESATAVLGGGMTGPCPGTGWASAHVVSSKVSNQAGGIDRNVFEYECGPGAPATCPAAAADYARITNVGIELFVDDRVGDSLREMRVSTGVFLRNQNEPPVAGATWVRKAPQTVIFNGASSTDPEGRTLEYFWFKGTEPTNADFPDCTAKPDTALADGATYTHQFSEAVGTPINFWLVVRDPGCLTSKYHVNTPALVVPS
jgi:prepilin-type N-terminal cleavage/methylation domain-containing protein